MHPTEIVENMVKLINAHSDMDCKAFGTKIQFTDLSYVQPEVLECVTRAAIVNGIVEFKVEIKPKGGVVITVLASNDQLCVICGGTEATRQDDGVCNICRDPNVEPGEQDDSPIGIKTRAVLHAKLHPK